MRAPDVSGLGAAIAILALRLRYPRVALRSQADDGEASEECQSAEESSLRISDRTQTVLGRHCRHASSSDIFRLHARICEDSYVRLTQELRSGSFRPDEAKSRHFPFPLGQ